MRASARLEVFKCGGCRDGDRCTAPTWQEDKGLSTRWMKGMTTWQWRYCWRLVLFDMDRGAELTVINADINVQECDMGGGEGVPCKVWTG